MLEILQASHKMKSIVILIDYAKISFQIEELFIHLPRGIFAYLLYRLKEQESYHFYPED